MDIQLNESTINKEFIHLLTIRSPSQYEHDVATYIKQRCREMDIDVIEDQTQNVTDSNVGNIICTIKGTCTYATPIFFTAHMDTIEDQHVRPIIQDEWVMTDGTTALGADDKVGIIALLETIRYLKDTDQPHGDIQLLFTVCEEQGLVGARSFDPALLDGSIGYTVDADEPVGTFITKSPALAVGTITVRAVNEQTADDVNQVIAGIVRSIFSDDLPSTVSLSIIGFQENKETEDYAMDVSFQVRASYYSDMAFFMNRIKKDIIYTYDQDRVSVHVSVENICSGYAYTSSDPIVQLANRAAKNVGVQPVQIELLDVSDANVLVSNERDAMNIGAGYEQMHTNHERIALTELYALIQLLISICLEASRK